MKFKKLRSICMALLLTLIFSHDIHVFATEEMTFNASQIESDGSVTLTATAEVIDMYGFEIKASFDATKLEYLSGEVEIADGFTVDQGATGNEIIFAYSRTGQNPGLTGKIKLATFKFKVKSNAIGSTAVTWASLTVVKAETSTKIKSTPNITTTLMLSEGSSQNQPPGNSTTPGTTPSSSNFNTDKESVNLAPTLINGVAKFEIKESALIDMFKKGKTNEHGVIQAEINAAYVSSANSYELSMPSSLFQLGQGKKQLIIQTPLAAITIPDNMLKSQDIGNAAQVELVVSSVDHAVLNESVQKKIGNRPVIELNILLDGKRLDWKNNEVLVNVAFKYSPTRDEMKNPEHIAIWYVDGEGKIVKIPSGKYDLATGMMTFNTTHFSYYTVGYERISFEDLVGYSWAQQQIEVMASKGIIEGISDSRFEPDRSISRGDFILLLTKTLELTADVKSNFNDIPTNAYYAEAAGVAKTIGIAEGDDMGALQPDRPITRQDLMTLLSRALKLKGQLSSALDSDLSKFEDMKEITPYALNAIADLVKSGIVQGDGKHLNPRAETTRAEAAVLLYRVYTN